MEQALSGFRVLDFGQYIKGPYAAMLLAEQGAEVIKVERPGGDPMRPQPGFMVWNRSKMGITLDLKTQRGRQVARELAGTCDVLIENSRPGVAERLGIGYETLHRESPRMVYCSISGFGQKGPHRDLPAWDPIVASMGGLYVEQSGEGNPPLYIVMHLPSRYAPSHYAALAGAFAVTRPPTAGRTTMGLWRRFRPRPSSPSRQHIGWRSLPRRMSPFPRGGPWRS